MQALPYNTILTEQDVRLFLREAPKSNGGLKRVYIGITSLVFGMAALYGVLNYNALLRVYSPSNTPQLVVAAPVAEAPISSGTPAPTPVPAPTIPENTLAIGSLGISAPIGWDASFDEKEIQKQLANNIVHFAGTAKPGQKGHVVITGHSSNYPWAKGQYNTIFAPLHNAAEGTIVLINYQNKEYQYRVTKTFQIKPDQVEVLQSNGGSGLRLITCTPVGTSLRRLVVEAEQISPDPIQNEEFSHQNFTGSVPGAR
jgi:LPXTG-site transpeptidase (sortase) family protein